MNSGFDAGFNTQRNSNVLLEAHPSKLALLDGLITWSWYRLVKRNGTHLMHGLYSEGLMTHLSAADLRRLLASLHPTLHSCDASPQADILRT